MADVESARPQYSKPPVVEAVIEFQFGDALNDKELTALRSKFIGEYPLAIENRAVIVTIDQNGSTTSKVELAGHRLSTADGTDILQTSRQGVVISRVPPYPGWEHLLERAQKTFEGSRSAIGYHEVKRVGVRYINRIDFPIKPGDGPFDPSTILNIYPHVPGGMQSASKAFATRHEYDLEGGLLTVIVQTVRVEPALVDHLGILLDIDVLQQKTVPQKPDELWSLLSTCAIIKNQVFEKTITDTLRERFK